MSQTAGIADMVTHKGCHQIKTGREGRTGKMRRNREDKQKTEGAADRRRS
jgi:hypothetical protein